MGDSLPLKPGADIKALLFVDKSVSSICIGPQRTVDAQLEESGVDNIKGQMLLWLLIFKISNPVISQYVKERQ